MRKLTGLVLGAGFALAAGGALADTTISPQARYQANDEGRINVGYDAGVESGASVVTGPADVETDGRAMSGEWQPESGWRGGNDVVTEKEVGAKTPDVNDVPGRS